jgi:ribose transport system ATP-binding protein
MKNTSTQNPVLLAVAGMEKSFGPVRALNGVDIEVRQGEIAGIIGENGSGKSTITSIIAGMQRGDRGMMLFQGKAWRPETMAKAQRDGIGMVLQEANTVPHCTVAENIFAGRLDEFSRLGCLNTRKMNAAAEERLAVFGIKHIRAVEKIDRYGFEDRKLVEIVRSMANDPQILIIDETTTALSYEGRALLYGLIKRMAEEQRAVIFISHDIDEILEHCTNLIVLRDGNITGKLGREDLNESGAAKKIRRLMVGREIGDAYYREDYNSSHGGTVELEMKAVSFGAVENFSLTLYRGEIAGIGGLSGCGMHEIGRAAFGLEPLKQGGVTVRGNAVTSPLSAIKNGMGYISKNRDTEALILAGAIGDNIALPSIPFLSKLSFISPGKEKKLVKSEIERLAIKCTGAKQWVNTLSGGNKQKVSFAKWTAKGCEIFIMDCPTRGVDVGVKQAMYAFIAEMKKQGKAILIISEELPELIGMADRIIIMKDFKISKEFKRSPDLKETDIIGYMI